ncbi:MAG: FkbM family methyltransferase, partial [Candidatus Fonsibacter sp.]
ISLEDVLKKFNAPLYIDYLSVDTEGSEFEILKNFNFSMFTFKIITCEHNFTKNRQKIFNLLSQKGYVRKFKNLSQFDDWYINSKFDVN